MTIVTVLCPTIGNPGPGLVKRQAKKSGFLPRELGSLELIINCK